MKRTEQEQKEVARFALILIIGMVLVTFAAAVVSAMAS